MGFNEFISKIFGNKATRDMKEIQPWGKQGKGSISGNPEVDER